MTDELFFDGESPDCRMQAGRARKLEKLSEDRCGI